MVSLLNQLVGQKKHFDVNIWEQQMSNIKVLGKSSIVNHLATKKSSKESERRPRFKATHWHDIANESVHLKKNPLNATQHSKNYVQSENQAVFFRD